MFIELNDYIEAGLLKIDSQDSKVVSLLKNGDSMDIDPGVFDFKRNRIRTDTLSHSEEKSLIDFISGAILSTDQVKNQDPPILLFVDSIFGVDSNIKVAKNGGYFRSNSGCLVTLEMNNNLINSIESIEFFDPDSKEYACEISRKGSGFIASFNFLGFEFSNYFDKISEIADNWGIHYILNGRDNIDPSIKSTMISRFEDLCKTLIENKLSRNNNEVLETSALGNLLKSIGMPDFVDSKLSGSNIQIDD